MNQQQDTTGADAAIASAAELANAAAVLREAAAAGHWVIVSPTGRAWIGERLSMLAAQAMVDSDDPDAAEIIAEAQKAARGS